MQWRPRVDLAGRSSLRIKTGDLILNRQNKVTLLQTSTAAFAKSRITVGSRLSGGGGYATL